MEAFGGLSSFSQRELQSKLLCSKTNDLNTMSLLTAGPNLSQNSDGNSDSIHMYDFTPFSDRYIIYFMLSVRINKLCG